jgi:hypothetical protein
MAAYACRFANMDFIFLSAVCNTALLILVASYDIACQWKCNLESRIKQFPEYLQLDLVVTAIRYLIPKFHLPGHGLTCQSRFSHSLAPGVGRTDGEGIERDWSWINPAATSTKQMGPGARHDTLDDHWGDMNWREMLGLRKHRGDN